MKFIYVTSSVLPARPGRNTGGNRVSLEDHTFNEYEQSTKAEAHVLRVRDRVSPAWFVTGK